MKTNKKLFILLIMGCILFFSASIAYSAVLHVPGRYLTIQQAVDAAGKGDTIIVSTSVYEESVTLTEGLTLVGLGLPTVGSPSSANFLVANDCIIDGFKIHSLKISGKSNVIIKNCVLLGKDDVLTSATIENAQDIVIEHNTFSDEYYGGTAGNRVAISTVQDLTFRNNVVLTKNTDAATANITALSLDTVSNSAITNNVVKAESHADGRGVGIQLSNMTNTAIHNNIIFGTTYSIDGDSANVTISYNDLPEGVNHVGTNVTLGSNNFSVEPVFVEGEGFYLKPTSPCVDAGIIEETEQSDVGSYKSITFYPEDFTPPLPTLQEVIDAAGPNDTIYLGPGLYAASPYTIKNADGTADVTSYATRIIGKDIHIVGSGRGNTFIWGPVQFIFSDGSLENVNVISPNNDDLVTEVDYDLDGRQDYEFTGSILIANGSPVIENVMIEPNFDGLRDVHGVDLTGIDGYGTGIPIIENTSGSPTSPIIRNVVLKKFADAIRVMGNHDELVLSPVVEHCVFDLNINGFKCETLYALPALRNNIFSGMLNNAIDLFPYGPSPYIDMVVDNIQSNYFFNNGWGEPDEPDGKNCLYMGAQPSAVEIDILANNRNNQGTASRVSDAQYDPNYLKPFDNMYATKFDSPAIAIDAGLEHYSKKEADRILYYDTSATERTLLAEETLPDAGGDFTRTIYYYDVIDISVHDGYAIQSLVGDMAELHHYDEYDASDTLTGSYYADGTSYPDGTPGVVAPTVALVSPNGPGLLLKGTIPITWTATDADGDPLSIDISYSKDGAPYEGLVLGLKNDGIYEWQSADYADSSNYKIKVKGYKTNDSDVASEAASSNAFALDNTLPAISISSPVDNTGVGVESITVQGTVSDTNLDAVEAIVVNHSADWITADITSLPNFTCDVEIPIGGARAIIVVQATDKAGNISTDRVGIIKGYMRYIPLVKYYKREDNLNNLSSIAAAQDLIHLMSSKDYDYPDMPLEEELYSYGLPRNDEGHRTTGDELDALGLSETLQHYDPYGSDHVGYNYGYNAIETFDAYLKDIIRWLSWAIVDPGAPSPHPEPGETPETHPEYYCRAPYMAALAPLSAYIEGYSRWAVINGCAADMSPLSTDEPYDATVVNPDIEVYGLFMTDPQTRGIGQDMYIPAASLNDYLEPLGIAGPYMDKYVSVVEPPAGLDFELDIAEPVINKSTLALLNIAEFVNDEAPDDFSSHLVDGTLVVDLDEPTAVKTFSTSADLVTLFDPAAADENNSSINWKDIIPSAQLLHEEFREAVQGSEVRDFIKVHRSDTGEDYYIIPFDRLVKGNYLSKAAILTDAATSAVTTTSYVEEPVRYIQITKEKAIEAVIELYPEAKTKEIDATLAWEPGGLTLSPFYPYWEVTAGDSKYCVAE